MQVPLVADGQTKIIGILEVEWNTNLFERNMGIQKQEIPLLEFCKIGKGNLEVKESRPCHQQCRLNHQHASADGMIWVMDSIPWQCSKLYFYEDKPYNSQQYQQTTEQSVPRICLEINSQKESNWILILTWADLQLRFLLDFSSLAFWRKSLSQCLPNPTSIFFCFFAG